MTFQQGDLVFHKKLGPGKVVQTSTGGPYLIEVVFDRDIRRTHWVHPAALKAVRPRFSIGERVRHPIHGPGTVRKMGESLVYVEFDAPDTHGWASPRYLKSEAPPPVSSTEFLTLLRGDHDA